MDSGLKSTCLDESHLDNSQPNSYMSSIKVPSIELPDDLFEQALKPWRFSLIGRLNLQHIKFVDVVVILRQQWKLTGECKLISLGIGFFTIKLDNELDRRTIKAGQWEVLNQVLQVRNWISNFRPSNQRTSKIQVWFRFPGLGLEFWKESILFKICKEIGTPIKIDDATANYESGYYANVWLRWISLNQFLTKYGGFFQNISIPIIPKYCHHCKIIGHSTTDCRIGQPKINTEGSAPQKTKSSVGSPHTPFDICDRSEIENSPSKVQASTSFSNHNLQLTEDSLVTNITTPATQQNSSAINPNLVGGRFSVLNSDDDKEEKDMSKEDFTAEIAPPQLMQIVEVTKLENNVVKFIDAGTGKITSQLVLFTTWSSVVKTSAEKKTSSSSTMSNNSNTQASHISKNASEVVKNVIPGNNSGRKFVNPVAHKYAFRRNIGKGGPKNLQTKP
ncbi:uncharacterized protein LOC113312687 [Papaver somniferum]|uniref:uncharacterized protein LOC113312687 n=1 Tax=Papaver somniferum TaxID=3469 RepID=UPI000E702E9B|nr:uncharacterized protein LOC113312687 [Papaver somniferum]